MTREEAVAVLRELIEAIEDDQAYSQMTYGMYKDGYRRIDAYKTAIAALRKQGWVRTSERVPTEADDGEFGVVLAYNKALSKEDEMGLAACVCAWVVREGPEWWTYWMPLPALPEVEG